MNKYCKLSDDGMLLKIQEEKETYIRIKEINGVFVVFRYRHDPSEPKIASFKDLDKAKQYLLEYKRIQEDQWIKEEQFVKICEMIRTGFQDLTETIMAELKKSLTLPYQKDAPDSKPDEQSGQK